MKILAIDTSCDDTSVAISDNRKILSNVFWSKLKVHNDWGGVVPSEAKRQHEEFLEPAIETALKEASLDIKDIDAIAVTYGPGLAIALEAGIKKAKDLAIKYDKKLIAVNHMIGHIYASLAEDSNGESLSSPNSIPDFEFPALALTISGGHTDLYLMKDHLDFEHIGRTLDDAVGESFDKVGRMLGMGFPAGAKIEAAAKNGNEKTFNFPRPLSNTNDFNWSYSGLKTAVLYEIKKLLGEYEAKPEKNKFKLEDISNKLTEDQVNNIAAAFQAAASDSLIIKIKKAIEANHQIKMIIVGGGVIANQNIRNKIEHIANQYNIKLTYPKPMWLCTDNASMIAIAAYYYAQKNLFIENENINQLDRIPNLEI
jgi:N6-L-threonylcarbamoyladenine synthase